MSQDDTFSEEAFLRSLRHIAHVSANQGVNAAELARYEQAILQALRDIIKAECRKVLNENSIAPA